MKFKNYILKLIGGDVVKMTAEDAAQLTNAWMQGVDVVVYNGAAYAKHQICSISPMDRGTEKDQCEMHGIDPKNPPRIEQFMSGVGQTPNKLLK